MSICKGDIRLGTACGKCQRCVEAIREIPAGHYWALPKGEEQDDLDAWVVLHFDGANFWQIGSDAAVAPWNIAMLKNQISARDYLKFGKAVHLARAVDDLRDLQVSSQGDQSIQVENGLTERIAAIDRALHEFHQS